MLRNIFCWKGFGPVTGPPSFPGANFQQMVIARLSLGLSFLGLRNFLNLCHDEKPCTWWLGEKGLGSLQSRLARMLHHEYDALKGYRFLGGAISFYSVSCMSDVIFNPSLLNWSSLILTVAHMTLGTGGSPGVDMVDATHEVGGGVGWGGDDNVLCTCTHGWCYATSCFLHLHTWLVLRSIMFLALAHMVGATQHHGVGWGWGGVGWGW